MNLMLSYPDSTSLNGLTVQLPKIPYILEKIGSVQLTSLYIEEGIYIPYENRILIEQGVVRYQGGKPRAFFTGRRIDVSDIRVYLYINSMSVTGFGCIPIPLIPRCRVFTLDIDYQDEFNRDTLLDLIKRRIGTYGSYLSNYQ